MSERLYGDLAPWWPLMAPARPRRAEARALVELLQATGAPLDSLLELGSGSGALASHMTALPELWLVDRSAEMLALSKALNEGREHILADISSLDLGRQFDAVLLHDAVMYLSAPGALDRALAAAALHLRPGGHLVVVPDVLEDSFKDTLRSGSGADPDSGRACALTEWHWDPVPGDGCSTVEMSLLLREPGQPVQAVHETHTLLLISRAALWAAIRRAGLLPVEADIMAAMRLGEVFVARKPG